jgi:hypothetical protein
LALSTATPEGSSHKATAPSRHGLVDQRDRGVFLAPSRTALALSRTHGAKERAKIPVQRELIGKISVPASLYRNKILSRSMAFEAKSVPEHGKFFASQRELNRPKREFPGIPKIAANDAGRRRREGSYPSLNHRIADDLDSNMATIHRRSNPGAHMPSSISLESDAAPGDGSSFAP